MLGYKARDFRPLTEVSLEDLVPEDNFYRQVEHTIDFGFVRGLAGEFYSCIRRPSIDPVVFFKLQLIAFFEGIRSERQLMETVNLNLAHRWFIGYDLDEPVPDHSSLSKIRERYGLEVFQRFFEHIVELCIEAGLVWGSKKIPHLGGWGRWLPIGKLPQHLCDVIGVDICESRMSEVARFGDSQGNRNAGGWFACGGDCACLGGFSWAVLEFEPDFVVFGFDG